jgi:uncharacterized protein (TIGR00251 family)
VNEKRAGFELAQTKTGVAFWIHVSPRSRRPNVGGAHGDALRVAVSEPPVDGAANEGCVKALARALGVRRAAVALDPASTGRRKRVKIDGDFEALEERLLGLASAARAD